jgi:hypothetical protein
MVHSMVHNIVYNMVQMSVSILTMLHPLLSATPFENTFTRSCFIQPDRCFRHQDCKRSGLVELMLMLGHMHLTLKDESNSSGYGCFAICGGVVSCSRIVCYSGDWGLRKSIASEPR